MGRNQIRFTSQNHYELATQVSKIRICIRSVICNIKIKADGEREFDFIYTEASKNKRTS
ncbi:hypothetical protein FMO003_36140 [Moritella sp. F3]|nr:hypothetical protein FMO001_21380 [Moritella sp. F1]GIC83334.1 hypothetical protein FMO003_36140 [Moritella sp. F3]